MYNTHRHNCKLTLYFTILLCLNCFAFDYQLNSTEPTPSDFYLDSSDPVEDFEYIPRHKRQSEDFNIAYKIRQGKIQSALEEYNDQRYRHEIDTVIKLSYANDLSNLFNVMKFANYLPTNIRISIIFPVLFEQMKTYGHFDTAQGLSLDFQIKEIIQNPRYKNHEAKYGSRFDEMLNDLRPHLEFAKLNLISKLKIGDISELVELIGQNYKAYEHYIPEIIQSVYEHRDNAKSILKLVQYSPWVESMIVTTICLHKEMVTHNHVDIIDSFLLASLIKRSISMRNYHRVSQEYKNMIENLKSSLQSYRTVELLLWKESAICKVRNVRQNEYLYADYWTHGDSDGRHVSTKRSVSTGDAIEWKFTFAGFFEEGVTFTVTSVQYATEYLHSYVNGEVRTRHDYVKGSEWVLEPVFYKPNFPTFKLRKINARYLGIYGNNNNIREYFRNHILGVQVSSFWLTYFYGDVLINFWDLKCK